MSTKGILGQRLAAWAGAAGLCALCTSIACGHDDATASPGVGGAGVGGAAGAAGSGDAGGTAGSGGDPGGAGGASGSGGTGGTVGSCAEGGNHLCGAAEACPGLIVPTTDTSACCDVPCEPVAAETVYVDNTIATATCETYSVASRACGSGTDTAYDSLAGAAAVAQAGWAVYVRGGTYQEPLVVQHSGMPGAHVLFARYGDEVPTITGPSLAPGVDLSSRQYVIVDGLVVDQVQRWLYAVDAHHNVLRNNTFSRAMDGGGSSKTGVFFQDATHNRIVNNRIEDSTQDNLALHHCDHNLIEGNTIRKAAHTLWAIKCGSYNVVRGNRFHNEDQKIGEVYDCDASGFDHEITMFDATKHNLIEGNLFEFAVKYYSTSGGNGIQYAGQSGVIRRNAFHDTNTGLGLQRYSDEADHNTHNRIYHNVFYGNECGGVGLGAGTAEQFGDNLLMNNILHGNVGCEAVGDAQITYRALAGFAFVRNDIMGPSVGADVVQELFEAGGTLASFEATYPALFHDNLEIDPGFVAADSGEFGLAPGSKLIDQGWFLTTATGAGSGTSLVVADAGFFYDGFGIEGETGDVIQLEGQTTTATILSIDYDANTLTLDAPLTWTSGVGVSLAYNGIAPDVGMVEAD